MENNRLDFLQLARIAKERGTLTKALCRAYLKGYARAVTKQKDAATTAPHMEITTH